MLGFDAVQHAVERLENLHHVLLNKARLSELAGIHADTDAGTGHKHRSAADRSGPCFAHLARTNDAAHRSRFGYAKQIEKHLLMQRPLYGRHDGGQAALDKKIGNGALFWRQRLAPELRHF